MILRADINERIEQYGRLLTAIQTGGNLQEVAWPLQLTTDEARRILETLNGDLYLMKRIRQYVLLRLDSSLAQAEAVYDYPIISVEHVLPQNPNKSSVWVSGFLSMKSESSTFIA
jgi:Protein of unknown function (DUF1524)